MDIATPHLRPLTLGDLFDAVFRIYRANFLTLLGIVALLQVPMIVLQLLIAALFGQRSINSILELVDALQVFDPRYDQLSALPLSPLFTYLGLATLLSIFQALVVQQLVQAALASATAQHYLRSAAPSIGSAYRPALRSLGSLVVGALALGSITLLAVAVAAAISFGLLALLAGVVGTQETDRLLVLSVFALLLFLGLTVLAVLAVGLLLVRLIFYIQAAVIEGLGPLAALRRSWQLVGGSYWRVLGTVLLLVVLGYMLLGLPAVFASVAINAAFPNQIEDFAIRQSLQLVVNYLGQLLVLPLQLIAYTLLYYDLRVRREGFDMELRLSAGDQGH